MMHLILICQIFQHGVACMLLSFYKMLNIQIDHILYLALYNQFSPQATKPCTQ